MQQYSRKLHGTKAANQTVPKPQIHTVLSRRPGSECIDQCRFQLSREGPARKFSASSPTHISLSLSLSWLLRRGESERAKDYYTD